MLEKAVILATHSRKRANVRFTHGHKEPNYPLVEMLGPEAEVLSLEAQQIIRDVRAAGKTFYDLDLLGLEDSNA